MVDERLAYFLLARFSGSLGTPSKTLDQLLELVLRVDQLEHLTICIFCIFEVIVGVSNQNYFPSLLYLDFLGFP